MRLQVEQLEKEKREREARLRVIAKRIDHVERAYRQEERPLLVKDYELQQASDRGTFEQVQKGRIDAARLDHKRNLETKKRLSRVLPEFEARKAIILEKRGAEYERKLGLAQAKIEEEKTKRRTSVLKAREAERVRQEDIERANREAAEAERNKREGASIAWFHESPSFLTSPPQIRGRTPASAGGSRKAQARIRGRARARGARTTARRGPRAHQTTAAARGRGDTESRGAPQATTACPRRFRADNGVRGRMASQRSCDCCRCCTGSHAPAFRKPGAVWRTAQGI